VRIGRAANSTSTLIRELPLLLVVDEESALDQFPSICVRGERERAEFVRHEVVQPVGVLLLAVKEQKLLEIEVAGPTTGGVKQQEKLPLPRRDH